MSASNYTVTSKSMANTRPFIAFCATLFFLVTIASAKTAGEYFTQAAALYAEAKLPTAANEAREGLARFPADSKLQNLLKRIEEAQKEQKKENDKQNPGDKGEQGNSSSNSDKNSSQGGQSSNSQEQPPEPQGNSSAQGQSSSDGSGDSSETPLQEGQLNKDQAEQLLKDFQENDKERKRNLKLRGRAAPEKDW